MSQNFVQSRLLRAMLLGSYRLYAQAHLFRQGPRIFVNSIPKAGTHLLTAELEKFPELMNSRLHFEDRHVGECGHRGEYRFDGARLESLLHRVRGGQFLSAHLFWYLEAEKVLERNNIPALFLIRDPRDILVSRYYYIMGARRHRLHAYLQRGLHSEEARWRVLVEGSPDAPFIRPMSAVLKAFIPWTRCRFVLTVRYEELVGAVGGGTTEAREAVLTRIGRHCGLSTAVVPQLAAFSVGVTPTLRAGRALAWRTALPGFVADLVHETCASELEQMGYRVGL